LPDPRRGEQRQAFGQLGRADCLGRYPAGPLKDRQPPFSRRADGDDTVAGDELHP
jgi:hypothetical protein